MRGSVAGNGDNLVDRRTGQYEHEREDGDDVVDGSEIHDDGG